MPSAATQSLIDELWDFDQPGQSEQRFRAALMDAGDAAAAIEITTQIGRAQGLQRRFDDAHATLDDVALSLKKHEHDPRFAPARVRYWLERGRTLNSSGQTEKAQGLFQQAWNAGRAAGLDALAVDAAHMIAIVSSPAGSLKWNLAGVALAEHSADPRARQWLASLHNNIGWTLHDRGEFAAALVHFEKALELRSLQGKPREVRVAQWCIARALRSLGRVADALTIQQSLLADAQKGSDQPDGYVAEELGECLLTLDRAAEASAYFAMAYRILSQDPWLRANEPRRLHRLEQLAGQLGH